MMTLEKMKAFARTAALKDRRNASALSQTDFEKALNAYARIDALTSGEQALPVPPLFLHKALEVYHAARGRFGKRAA